MRQNLKKDVIFRVVVVSRLAHKIKGQHLVIEAINRLNKKGIKNIHLDLIGDGASQDFLQELTRKYNLEDSINFLGLKSREFVFNNLKNYDLLVQPSIYEGFGLTVVEAMLAKVPVLVSENDGPIEIIQSGKFGYYFTLESIEDLVSEIELILRDYSSKQMIEKVDDAYNYAKNTFDITRTAERYFLEYKTID